MKKVAITDPSYDIPTKSLSYWINIVVDHIKSLKGIEPFHLKGVNVTPDQFANYITSEQPGLVLLNGHGNSDRVCGHNGVPLVRSGHESTTLLKNRIVHTLACKAGQQLGPDLVAQGTTAFVGYKENFQFHHMGDEGNDPIASLFLEPAYEVAKELASGKPTKEAHRASQRKYAQSIRAVFDLDNNSATILGATLMHDARNHVLLGDEEAVF